MRYTQEQISTALVLFKATGSPDKVIQALGYLSSPLRYHWRKKYPKYYAVPNQKHWRRVPPELKHDVIKRCPIKGKPIKLVAEKSDTHLSPTKLRLNLLILFSCNNTLLVFFHIILRHFPIIRYTLVCNEILCKTFLQQCIPFVLLILEDTQNGIRIPYVLSSRGLYPLFCQFFCDLIWSYVKI